MKICKKCKHWEKGRVYPHNGDWGLCKSEKLHKDVSISTSMLGTFEGFGCIHFERKIFVRM